MCGSGSVFGIFCIRIQKAPEYGSNTDPDPQHWIKMKMGIGIRIKTARIRPTAM